MKIADIRVTPLVVPLGRRFGGSSYHVLSRCPLVVELVPDDGPVARIYIGDERDEQEALVRLLMTELRPLLLGRDPREIEEIWHSLMQLSVSTSTNWSRHLYMQALSAVDIALWDLAGRVAGVPLYRLFGGSGSPLRAMIIGGYYEQGRTHQDLALEARGYLDGGAGGMKLKVGGLRPEEDLARLAAVREAVGDDFWIACDANQGWELADALQFADGAREYGMAWFEEPIVWYDQYRGMREIRLRTGVAVCAGQSECSLPDVQRLIDGGCVDFVNYDVGIGGGPTGWRKIAAYAELHGCRMAHHEEPQVAMHLLASVRQGLAVEFFHEERDPVWPAIQHDPPPFSEGYVTPSERPGLGLELDDSFLQRHHIATIRPSGR